MSLSLIPEDGFHGRERAAAFFDLDRTLIRGSANFPLAVAAFRNGFVPAKDLFRDVVHAVRFVMHGSTDDGSAALRERILRAVAGHHSADVIALGDGFIPQLADAVLPEARALLARHAKAGHDRIVVSASPIEIVSRLADRLGLEGAVGTRAEIDEEGRYTGRLAGAFCYREGKVTEIEQLARTQGYDLSASYGYSDSISDLPFLRTVGHPVAVNPDAELRAHALAHRWPVVEVHRPSVASRLLRTLPLPAT